MDMYDQLIFPVQTVADQIMHTNELSDQLVYRGQRGDYSWMTIHPAGGFTRLIRRCLAAL